MGVPTQNAKGFPFPDKHLFAAEPLACKTHLQMVPLNNHWSLGKAGVDSSSGPATTMYFVIPGNPGDPHWTSTGHLLLDVILADFCIDILTQYSREIV